MPTRIQKLCFTRSQAEALGSLQEDFAKHSKIAGLKWLVFCILTICVSAPTVGQIAGKELKPDQIDFAHDILPVLKSACAKCHSNDVYKGGLSLETRDALLDSGTVEIGDREQSELFARITSEDLDTRMPPEGDALTDAQIEKFGQWIDGELSWPAEISLKQKKFARQLTLQTVVLPGDGGESNFEHPIDRILETYFKLHSVGYPEPLNASQFYRRAKLDLLGQLPTPNELKDLPSWAQANDAEAYVDGFLSRDRDYADHWLSFWNDLLRNDYVGTGYIDGGRRQITQWLHRSLMENKPYDKFVQELINPADESSGFIKGIKWRGKVNASQVEPLQFSQNVSQVFLGINMKCASCHNSFIDDWKLEDAYGLAAITANKPLELHRCDVATGKMASSKFVFPQLGEIDQALPRKERLARLAELMVLKQNGRFSRTIVNRIWHRLVGRGLVHPVDMMANEAWSEPLLDCLANDLVENGYDLKRTLRLIATSKIYRSAALIQQTESPVAARADAAHGSDESSNTGYVFRGVAAKRLTAEQLVDAIWGLTQTTPTKIDAAVQLPGKPASGKWIWNSKSFTQSPAGEKVTFRFQFDVPRMPTFASAVVACDNEFQVFLNGKSVGKGKDWANPNILNLLKRIKPGTNELLVRGTNGGDSPNPAALFLQARISFDEDSLGPADKESESQPDLPAINFHTDSSWQFANGSLNPLKIPVDTEWKPAVDLDDANGVYKPGLGRLESQVARLSAGELITSRASLVKSNDLMRSLGRPNREQVVTTRPEELSTLQALDLSNGATLSRWLSKGAKDWVGKKKEQQWSNKTLVSNLFMSALSRGPSDLELELLLADADATASTAATEQQWVEDVLWMVLMLPEFQFVQ